MSNNFLVTLGAGFVLGTFSFYLVLQSLPYFAFGAGCYLIYKGLLKNIFKEE